MSRVSLPAAGRRGIGAALLSAAVLLHPWGAGADLVGAIAERAAVAGRTDAALVEANPLLRQLRREHPEALPGILKRLRAPDSDGGRGLEPSALATDEETAVFELNPDLGRLYRESPEAALDLLRLIREAARQR